LLQMVAYETGTKLCIVDFDVLTTSLLCKCVSGLKGSRMTYSLAKTRVKLWGTCPFMCLIIFIIVGPTGVQRCVISCVWSILTYNTKSQIGQWHQGGGGA
jgi:hypothetical protein